MRYCGIFDPVLLGRITLRQYLLMAKAIRLRHTDKMQDIHVQAWLNLRAKATKQRGKKTVPYFKSFDDFFQHPDRVSEKAQENDALKEMVLRANATNSG